MGGHHYSWDYYFHVHIYQSRLLFDAKVDIILRIFSNILRESDGVQWNGIWFGNDVSLPPKHFLDYVHKQDFQINIDSKSLTVIADSKLSPISTDKAATELKTSVVWYVYLLQVMITCIPRRCFLNFPSPINNPLANPLFTWTTWFISIENTKVNSRSTLKAETIFFPLYFFESSLELRCFGKYFRGFSVCLFSRLLWFFM